jgi:hypothetical protein
MYNSLLSLQSDREKQTTRPSHNSIDRRYIFFLNINWLRQHIFRPKGFVNEIATSSLREASQ